MLFLCLNCRPDLLAPSSNSATRRHDKYFQHCNTCLVFEQVRKNIFQVQEQAAEADMKCCCAKKGNRLHDGVLFKHNLCSDNFGSTWFVRMLIFRHKLSSWGKLLGEVVHDQSIPS